VSLAGIPQPLFVYKFLDSHLGYSSSLTSILTCCKNFHNSLTAWISFICLLVLVMEVEKNDIPPQYPLSPLCSVTISMQAVKEDIGLTSSVGSFDRILDGSEEDHQDQQDSPNRTIQTASKNLPSFLSLPTELVQEISSYLSPQSRCCFSLTNKAILHRVGYGVWSNPCITARRDNNHYNRSFNGYRNDWSIAFNYPHRIDLLRCLSRDMEGWDLCLPCQVLHRSLDGPRKYRQKEVGKRCLGVGGVIDYHPTCGEDGYVLDFEHIKSALEVSYGTTTDFQHDLISSFNGSKTIPSMDGSFEITYTGLRHRRLASYTLTFSATKIGSNLVLQTVHQIKSRSKHTKLKPKDILDTPIRLCPHQTTSTQTLRKKVNKWSQRHNGPLLTHAIKSAFPALVDKSSCYWKPELGRRFRSPTMTEQLQMACIRGPSDLWWCRNCPTQYQAKFEEEDFIVTVWQNFGPNEATAARNWQALVMSSDNSEFNATSKPFYRFGWK
jgi:hypothetical protein